MASGHGWGGSATKRSLSCATGWLPGAGRWARSRGGCDVLPRQVGPFAAGIKTLGECHTCGKRPPSILGVCKFVRKLFLIGGTRVGCPEALMAFTNLLLDKRDLIGTLTLNRPEKLNAMTPTLIEEMGEALT